MTKQENDYQKLRRVLGLTITDIAAELGISRSLYGMIEINHRRIPSDVLLELGKLIGALAQVESNREFVEPDAPLDDLAWLDDARKADAKTAARARAQDCLDEAAWLDHKLAQKTRALLKRNANAELCSALIAAVENPTAIQQNLLERAKLRLDAEQASISGAAVFALIQLRWKINALREEARLAQAFAESP